MCPRALIEGVLADTGKASRRERLLPAPAVVYYVMTLDGSCMDVADESANAAFFGYPGPSRGQSAFPQARLLGLVECATGTKLAWRAKADRKLPVDKVLPDGSYLSTVFDSADKRHANGQVVRVIEYTPQDSAPPTEGSYRSDALSFTHAVLAKNCTAGISQCR